ncbi:SWIM zinc finger family protein [Paenibacillus sp. IB182496]|uniref:SWIM zinc finger family protein n=1 Tax=Paenibacillus sabuli TaxID=2772509 RepID=A0A927GSW6_9BACL|nr:SWIM zinc finger family protein [Paenibacillus sabuli]MBD2846465.1 SWIM zinc finger family protein [Paenibacillus sabuli]
MDTPIRLADERLVYLEEQMAVHLPRHIISRGWEYYRARKVLTFEVVDDRTVYGAVDGSKVYGVVLDADHYPYSRCSCPYEGYCKHMAAVFFAYAANAGEDAETIYLRATGDVTPAPPAPAASDPNRPDRADGPEAWRAWFEAAFGAAWKQCRQSVHPMSAVLTELKGTARDWEKRRQRLHWLHAIEFVLEQVELAYAATDPYSRYYYEMSFTRTVDPWILQFNELAVEVDSRVLPADDEAWVEALLAALRRRALLSGPSLLRWDLLYHVLWERLAGQDEWRIREQAELERAAVGAERGSKGYTFVQAALAALDVAAQRDEAAVARLADADFDRCTELVYGFAEQRLEVRDWPRFGLWMDYLHEQLAACRNAVILRPYFQLCRKADLREPGETDWCARMVHFLPVAYQELAAHWLETRQYREWADLQMYVGVRPDELDVQELRAVSRAAGEVLIPLYHQAVDEAIHARNRQGYRTAAKLLKRLEKLYRAHGAAERWERYVDALAQRYARLRALQEELWKGKVLQ